ncbi:DUF4265 domain-containing protein [Streptomyces sp. BE303]|uniref:DUF4265 domain-containing protein n=1 Tax=Streptomyces sp. BE303 TaxID=3002528 RepID=UPI002E7A4FF5|nr:DUF4265 domain-containing protein [Streptomyces sp. BE303]MED7953990.1 DUF4265 domain-containing protein [Streptomyces sp. BE303]
MRTLIDGITYISHDNPALRGEIHRMAMVDLAPFDLRDTLEQLWLREDRAGRYEICCIPFLAYGLNLGDSVEIDDNDRVARVLERSGRRTIRIAFSRERPAADSRPLLAESISRASIPSEWNDDHYVAISLQGPSEIDPILNPISDEISRGTAFWEWADIKEFKIGNS